MMSEHRLDSAYIGLKIAARSISDGCSRAMIENCLAPLRRAVVASRVMWAVIAPNEPYHLFNDINAAEEYSKLRVANGQLLRMPEIVECLYTPKETINEY